MALTTVPVELANLDGAVTVNESSADVDFRVESNGNANMLFVDAGNNRVGIGTGSPTHEVTIGASGADAKRSFSIEGTNGSSQKSTFEIENDGENSVAKINFDTAGGTGTARMAIDGSGNVGINSTAPRIYTASFGSSDNVKHLTVKSASGSVLELAGASNSNGVGMGIVQFVNDSNDNNAANAGGKEIAMIMAQTVTSDTNTSSDSGGALRIFTKPEAGTTAERMRITSAGPIGIGKEYVTAGVGSAPHGSLLVGNTAANDYAMSIHNIANSAAAYGMQMTAGANDGSGTTYYIYAMDGDRTGVGQIANVSGTFALADLSDERLKENIKDTEIAGIDRVKALKVREFNWKKSGEKNIAGFVAQELETVMPEVVITAPDDLHDEQQRGIKSISRDMMVPTLVKAIQEQQTLIETLEAKVKALEEA